MIGLFIFIFVTNIFCSYAITIDNNPLDQSSLSLSASADAAIGRQWGLYLTGAKNAHDSGMTGANKSDAGDPIVIAVLDSGIDAAHPDLDANIVNNTDFTGQGTQDDTAHGTHVAGIIAAEANAIGVRGIAPDAKIYNFKVIGSGGVGDVAWMIDALQDLAAHHQPSLGGSDGVDIVSMSIGTIPADIGSSADEVQWAVDNCTAVGMILVAAAGNYQGTPDGINYPAVCDGVIACGAINQYEIVTTYSEYGSALDFVSCGGDAGSYIYSTFPIANGTYGQMVGTSQATPHLTGIIALLLGHGLANNNTIYEVLKSKCKDLGPVGFDTYYGWGFPQIISENPYYMELLFVVILTLILGVLVIVIPGRKE